MPREDCHSAFQSTNGSDCPSAHRHAQSSRHGTPLTQHRQKLLPVLIIDKNIIPAIATVVTW
jgi:hypothetical protein